MLVASLSRRLSAVSRLLPSSYFWYSFQGSATVHLLYFLRIISWKLAMDSGEGGSPESVMSVPSSFQNDWRICEVVSSSLIVSTRRTPTMRLVSQSRKVFWRVGSCSVHPNAVLSATNPGISMLLTTSPVMIFQVCQLQSTSWGRSLSPLQENYFRQQEIRLQIDTSEWSCSHLSAQQFHDR